MDINQAYATARAHHKSGRKAEAEQIYRAILKEAPDHPGALNLLGMLAHDAGRDEDSVRLIRKAIAQRPGAASYHNNLGIALAAMNRRDEAAAAYREALRLRPGYAGVLYNLGILLQAERNPAGALDMFDRALAANPEIGEARLARAGALLALHRWADAEQAFREIIAGKPDNAAALFELGSVLRLLGRTDEAVAAFRQVIRLEPRHAEAYNNLGAMLQILGDAATAIQCLRRSLALKPDSAEAWFNLGSLLEGQNQLEEAADGYRRALSYDPPFAAQIFFGACMVRRRMCDWRNEPAEIAELIARTEAHIRDNKTVALPPLTLNIFDVPLSLRLAVVRDQAKIIEGNVEEVRRRSPLVHTARDGGRLRVGYVSADFRQHAVGTLVQGLFEQHDRDAVEVSAYAIVEVDDPINRRIRDGVEHYVDVSRLSFEAIAERIHADRIDVLVDLAGYTTYSRTPLFALRPAPVQAHWLGYLDTMGADFLPYMIVDDTVVTDEMRALYPEALVTMPDGFTVATPLEIAATPPERSDMGLPDDAFVFCCFNSLHKLDARCFDAWMRILRRAPDAVLWLFDNNNALAVANLRREAEARGVSPDRIVFAGRLPFEAYLARYALADLFLDTFAYNAGATAIHALWSGLPLLTLPGRTIFGRMGASLCKSAGIPELVARSAADYEDRAVGFATGREDLAPYRARLLAARTSAPLFDPRRFAGYLEEAFSEMWRRHRDGTPAASFRVGRHGE